MPTKPDQTIAEQIQEKNVNQPKRAPVRKRIEPKRSSASTQIELVNNTDAILNDAKIIVAAELARYRS